VARKRLSPVHRSGPSGRNGHARNGASAPPAPILVVRVARPADVGHVPRIRALIFDAQQTGAIIAERTSEYLASAIRERRAVVVLRGNLLVGFAAAHAWENERFVSHSAMVVAKELRGRGLAHRMKHELIEISRKRWPDAAILSLTLSSQVENLNKAFGFESAPYCDLTKDPEFWKGCEGCIHHAHLKRNQQQDCHCWAGLLAPTGTPRDKVIPRDAHGHPSASGGG
jgi:N-acetylglutamate synthase-like GNAT family acetyltransferase